MLKRGYITRSKKSKVQSRKEVLYLSLLAVTYEAIISTRM
jgi:hypothetical protein